MKKQETHMERIDWIDSLKGMAITGIFLAHLSIGITWEGYIHDLFRFGTVGVFIFYMINAYLCVASYKQIDPKGIENIFWILKRVIRLFPLIWIWLIIKAIVYESFSMTPVMLSAFFLDVFFPQYWGTVTNGYISVLVLMWFLFPMVMHCIKTFRHSAMCVMIVYMVVKVAESVIFIVFIGTPIAGWAGYILIAVESFSVGIFLYYFIDSYKDKIVTLDKKVSYLIEAFGLFVILFAVYSGNYNEKRYDMLWFFSLIFIGVICNNNILFNNRIWNFLGRHSLEIFVIHLFMLDIFSRYFVDQSLFWLVNVVVSILGAPIINWLVTQPWNKVINNLFAKITTMASNHILN